MYPRSKNHNHLSKNGEVEELVPGLKVQLFPEDEDGLAGALQRERLLVVARGDGVADVGVGRVRLVPEIQRI